MLAEEQPQQVVAKAGTREQLQSRVGGWPAQRTALRMHAPVGDDALGFAIIAEAPIMAPRSDGMPNATHPVGLGYENAADR